MNQKRTYAPMNATSLATSILLVVISIAFVMPVSPSWGLAFASVGLIMLIASFSSLSEGPEELVKEYEARERRLWEEFEKKAEELRKSKEEIGKLREEKESLEAKIKEELSRMKKPNNKKTKKKRQSSKRKVKKRATKVRKAKTVKKSTRRKSKRRK